MAQATARVSKTIRASADEIWKTLTTRDTLKAFFFGADVETDWQVGHPIRFKGTFNGKRYEDKGEIQRIEPRKHLSFCHWSALAGVPDTPEHYHLVSFDLQPRGEATQITLTQANLTGGVTESDVKHRKEFERNWTMVLDGLDRVVVGKVGSVSGQ